jgi:hypothetical protein
MPKPGVSVRGTESASSYSIKIKEYGRAAADQLFFYSVVELAGDRTAAVHQTIPRVL